MISSSVNDQEVAKFSELSHEWWNPNGKFKTLHQINPIRLTYIKEKIIEHFGNFPEHLKLLDIGCGGGLVSIPLAKLGASVTGIDASQKNIDAAKNQALIENLDVTFMCDTAENHKNLYDVILCLEIIEHVQNPEEFIISVSKLLKPGGMLIISTINRTYKAYAIAIGCAEYILNWVPKGTHEFSKFVKPSELSRYLSKSGMKINELKGMNYNIFNRRFELTSKVDINYFAYCTKNHV